MNWFSDLMSGNAVNKWEIDYPNHVRGFIDMVGVLGFIARVVSKSQTCYIVVREILKG